jgi:membrane-bound serine protease (ClpP class)
VEIFITPGFGLMGISGIVFIGLSLVLSMQDFIIPVSDWEWGILGRNITMVGIGIVMAITGIAIIALLGPKIRLFNRLTLNTQITGTAGGPDPDTAEKGCTALIGLTGITVSTLRPAGKANFAGQVYAVESEGEFIDRGRFVVVTRVQGNRINVKFLDSLHLEEPATGSA